MAETGAQNRNRIPPLAIIVLVLLGIMVLIAAVRANGTMRTNQADMATPVDTPDEAVMPANGQALPGTDGVTSPPAQPAG